MKSDVYAYYTDRMKKIVNTNYDIRECEDTPNIRESYKCLDLCCSNSHIIYQSVLKKELRIKSMVT